MNKALTYNPYKKKALLGAALAIGAPLIGQGVGALINRRKMKKAKKKEKEILAQQREDEERMQLAVDEMQSQQALAQYNPEGNQQMYFEDGGMIPYPYQEQPGTMINPTLRYRKGGKTLLKMVQDGDNIWNYPDADNLNNPGNTMKHRDNMDPRYYGSSEKQFKSGGQLPQWLYDARGRAMQENMYHGGMLDSMGMDVAHPFGYDGMSHGGVLDVMGPKVSYPLGERYYKQGGKTLLDIVQDGDVEDMWASQGYNSPTNIWANNPGNVGTHRDNMDKNYYGSSQNQFQMGGSMDVPGGELNQISDNSVEVVGDNPQGVDQVELPDAMVDHGEMIKDLPSEPGQRVFSDTLKPPGSKETFAKLAKKLEKQKSPGMEDQNERIEFKLDELFQMQQLMNGDSKGESPAEAAAGGMQGIYQQGGKKDSLYSKDVIDRYKDVPTDSIESERDRKLMTLYRQDPEMYMKGVSELEKQKGFDDARIKMMREEGYRIPEEIPVSSSMLPEGYKKGGIYIKPENRGKFTASAKRAGKSVQQHAKSVLANPNATALQKKRANFARNAAKWKKQYGGVAGGGYDGESYYNEGMREERMREPYPKYQDGGFMANVLPEILKTGSTIASNIPKGMAMQDALANKDYASIAGMSLDTLSEMVPGFSQMQSELQAQRDQRRKPTASQMGEPSYQVGEGKYFEPQQMTGTGKYRQAPSNPFAGIEAEYNERMAQFYPGAYQLGGIMGMPGGMNPMMGMNMMGLRMINPLSKAIKGDWSQAGKALQGAFGFEDGGYYEGGMYNPNSMLMVVVKEKEPKGTLKELQSKTGTYGKMSKEKSKRRESNEMGRNHRNVDLWTMKTSESEKEGPTPSLKAMRKSRGFTAKR